MLLGAGFGTVDIVTKEESKEVIKDWIPGSGAEDFIISANITAWKPRSTSAMAASGTEVVANGAPPPAAPVPCCAPQMAADAPASTPENNGC